MRVISTFGLICFLAVSGIKVSKAGDEGVVEKRESVSINSAMSDNANLFYVNLPAKGSVGIEDFVGRLIFLVSENGDCFSERFKVKFSDGNCVESERQIVKNTIGNIIFQDLLSSSDAMAQSALMSQVGLGQNERAEVILKEIAEAKLGASSSLNFGGNVPKGTCKILFVKSAKQFGINYKKFANIEKSDDRPGNRFKNNGKYFFSQDFFQTQTRVGLSLVDISTIIANPSANVSDINGALRQVSSGKAVAKSMDQRIQKALLKSSASIGGDLTASSGKGVGAGAGPKPMTSQQIKNLYFINSSSKANSGIEDLVGKLVYLVSDNGDCFSEKFTIKTSKSSAISSSSGIIANEVNQIAVQALQSNSDLNGNSLYKDINIGNDEIIDLLVSEIKNVKVNKASAGEGSFSDDMPKGACKVLFIESAVLFNINSKLFKKSGTSSNQIADNEIYFEKGKSYYSSNQSYSTQSKIGLDFIDISKLMADPSKNIGNIEEALQYILAGKAKADGVKNPRIQTALYKFSY